ncbi:MAG: M43 family zinc metalloprotease [Agriterribacter sp.]
MNTLYRILCIIVAGVTVSGSKTYSQQTLPAHEKCAIANVMEKYFTAHPLQRESFEKRQTDFQQRYEMVRKQHAGISPALRLSSVVTIPVVVHVVLENPSLVTDAQVQGQIDILNKDYSGENADSVNIPSPFKSLFGKSKIQFCLAQRTPDNTATSGITRLSSSTQSLPGEQDPIKYTNQGGADAWNPDKYLNIWVCRMEGDQYLGYTFLPGLGIAPAEMGCVIAYTAFGNTGTATSPFNKGRTVTHEVGHYFNLIHVWGANGCVASCTDSDEVDDTPNEDKCFYGTPSFPQTDNCNSSSPGVMFMNYMDYSDDAVMCMFSVGQVDRMETALTSFPELTPLLTSDGCMPVALHTFDMEAQKIIWPNNVTLYCNSTSVTPQLMIRNYGTATIDSIRLAVVVDNGATVVKNITIHLASLQTATIAADNFTTAPGQHSITLYTTLPNGAADENTLNDTLSAIFSVTGTAAIPVTAGFETAFPPTGWGISNNSTTINYNPQKVTDAAHTSSASVKFNNYDYQLFGKYTMLSSPKIDVPTGADSVKVTFWRAAAQITNTASDTLQILYSIDCGQTFLSAYKKTGTQLVTRQSLAADAFTPAAAEWVSDTADLTNYVAAGKADNVIVQFRNINGYGNNLYLDDINIYSVTLPSVLKETGYLLAPNPTTGQLILQHYPDAFGMRAVKVFSTVGQLVWQMDFNNTIPPAKLNINISNAATGIYFVKVFYAGKNAVTKKILKIY